MPEQFIINKTIILLNPFFTVNQLHFMQVKNYVRFVSKDRNKFFSTLKSRVDLYFRENRLSKFANTTLIVKTKILLALYIVPFVFILTLSPPIWLAFIAWILMGVGMAGLGMSVMHDANHGAYSNNKIINYLMSNVIVLLGASGFNWKLQHNFLHHTYTNITHLDDDIKDKAILKFSPHTRVRQIHRFQWLLAFPLYGISTLYWVTVKDFTQFFNYIKLGVNKNTRKENNIAFTKIVISKVGYYFTFLVLPTVILGFSFWYIFLGFILMHITAGFILTLIFQLAHTVEEAHHPMPNDKGEIENDWAIHQLNTTVNFSRNSKLLSWYVGGLNFQVEHHLFPTISHVHYPKIAPIVKATAEEFGIPYLENETFGDALKSHLNMLRSLGRLPALSEAIG